ncbi:hypothetical protein BC829DRAFT_401126 [Chytridium lagenaria]|nr:hypothetical protein BC829DRAFT_401126 [Chytridium lagenaria]
MSQAAASGITEDNLSRLITFFKTETASPWSLEAKISVYLDPEVIDVLRTHWDDFASTKSSNKRKELAVDGNDGVEKSGIDKEIGGDEMEGGERKKLKVCRAKAELLLQKATGDPDEFVSAFAKMVLPYVALDPKDDPNMGPSVDINMEQWSPTFRDAMSKLEHDLLQKSILFNPPSFRYLDLSIVNASRHTIAPPPPMSPTHPSVPNGGKIAGGTFEEDGVTAIAAGTGGAGVRRPGGASRPTPPSVVLLDDRRFVPGLKRESRIKTLDVTEIVNAEQEVFDLKKKQLEGTWKAEEKRLRRLKAKEEKDAKDAAEKKAAAEEAKRKREAAAANAGESPGGDIGGLNGDGRRSSMDSVAAAAAASYRNGQPGPTAQPHLQHGMHPAPPHGHTQFPPGYHPGPPPPHQPAMMAYPGGQYSPPTTQGYPPASVVPLAPAPTAVVAPAVDVDAVLGPDTPCLTMEDRQKVVDFLTGRYERRAEKAEIKLSESTAADPATGATLVNSLFIVLDYEACKWRKIKRKRRRDKEHIHVFSILAGFSLF